MNDTNITILSAFRRDESLSSSEIHSHLGDTLALVTIKRSLSDLVEQGFLARTGAGRSVRYNLTRYGMFNRPVNIDRYLATPQEDRITSKQFNYQLFADDYTSVINDELLAKLDQATKTFHSQATDDDSIHKRELQRFTVEMSWKSAQIEGNTYTLLDTEKLLTYGIASTKNTEFETQMLLNQKVAFDFIWQTRQEWFDPQIAYIEKLHSYIIKNLGVKNNLRNSLVGITGTDYQPLANSFQIREALESLLTYVKQAPNTYEKVLLLTVGMSYIQPFNDGNKRTARMTANALLLAGGFAPISYRSVDETAYKEAMLVFYEQNSIAPFRELFSEQYVYSALNYNVAEMK